MSVIVLASEKLATYFEEALPLLQRHWREITHYLDIPLNIDLPGYLRMEAADLLRIYTARDRSKLVGYAVFIVGQNSHYHSSPRQAKQDVIYIAPEYRGRSVGVRLIRFCDEMLRAEGVQVVYQHAKLAHPELGRLLEHMGYEAVETTYARRLDRSGLAAVTSGGEDANKARAAAPLSEGERQNVEDEDAEALDRDMQRSVHEALH